MEFSFFGTCAWLSVAHWSARAYGCFEVGHLMSLLAFSSVDCGPSYLTQLSITQACCLKAASTPAFSVEEFRSSL